MTQQLTWQETRQLTWQENRDVAGDVIRAAKRVMIQTYARKAVRRAAKDNS